MTSRGIGKFSVVILLCIFTLFYAVIFKSDAISYYMYRSSVYKQLRAGKASIIHHVNNSVDKINMDKPHLVSNKTVTSFPGDPRAEVTNFTEDELAPVVNATKTILIPHIIHQTWMNYNVPGVFIPWIKSVLKHHEDWEYWFWTDADVECYMKEKHADFYQFYRSYPSPIYKVDIMRYFLLYDYGGFYMDLDIEVLKPLDPWSYISPSIVSHESYEHSYIVHEKRMRHNIINAVMATKQNHSYYKMLQDNIKYYWKIYTNKLLESTGPFFIDDIFRKYQTKPKRDKLTVLDPKYWFPTYDPWMETKVKKWCTDKTHQKKLMIQRICEKQRKRGFSNEPGSEAFLYHHWIHSYLQKPGFKINQTVYLANVIPHLVKVKDRLNLTC